MGFEPRNNSSIKQAVEKYSKFLNVCALENFIKRFLKRFMNRYVSLSNKKKLKREQKFVGIIKTTLKI